MQADIIEKLRHVSPNTPTNGQQSSDPRFAYLWCPFHKKQLVPLLAYVTDWGDVWFLCGGGCDQINYLIEDVLTKKAPVVNSYVTARGALIVYESRWSLGACDE